MSVPSVGAKKSSPFRELKEELKKISWTARGELMLSIQIVVLSTFLFGFAIYGVDLAIRGVLEMANWIVKAIVG